MPSFSGVTFVLFRFRLYAFVEAATFRSIALRNAGATTTTRVSSFFPFVSSFFSVFFYLVVRVARSSTSQSSAEPLRERINREKREVFVDKEDF